MHSYERPVVDKVVAAAECSLELVASCLCLCRST